MKGLVGVMLLAVCGGGYYTTFHPSFGQAVTDGPAAAPPEPLVVAPPPTQATFKGWQYTTTLDPLVGDETVHATVLGTAPIGPGAPRVATLELTASHQYGKHVIVTFPRVPKACVANACAVSVAWDQSPPDPFTFDDISAADKSRTILQIGEYDRFVGAMAKAHDLKIIAALGMQDDYVVNFTVAGFDPHDKGTAATALR
jgi:hypothetical protein